MMKIALTACVLGVALTMTGVAVGAGKGGGSSPHTVKGHVTKDGTYVPPHVRTSPNGTKLDNYSTKGNVNPYTGKEGTKDPFAPTPPRRP